MCASFNHLISVLCHKHTLTLPRKQWQAGTAYRCFSDGYRSCTISHTGVHGNTSGLLFERIISCRENLHSFRVGMPRNVQGHWSLLHPLTGALAYCGDRPPCPGGTPGLGSTEWMPHEMDTGTPSIRLYSEAQTWHTLSKCRWLSR